MAVHWPALLQCVWIESMDVNVLSRTPATFMYVRYIVGSLQSWMAVPWDHQARGWAGQSRERHSFHRPRRRIGSCCRELCGTSSRHGSKTIRNVKRKIHRKPYYPSCAGGSIKHPTMEHWSNSQCSCRPCTRQGRAASKRPVRHCLSHDSRGTLAGRLR